MGLFDKKECAICGGKVKGLLPASFGGEYVCKDCLGIPDIDDDIRPEMTLDDFRKYREFREENQKLKDVFQITKSYELGLIFNKIYLDTNNCMFCLSSDLSSTIFEAKDIDCFTITEDSFPLYEGTPEGLSHYPSEVPNYARSLTPVIIQMQREYDLHRNEDDFYQPPLEEPFQKFYITIHMKDHPYRKSIQLKYDGPIFTANRPDISQYVREYTAKAQEMDELARFLMDFMIAGGKASGEAVPCEATAETPAPAVEPAPASIEAAAEPAPAEEPAPVEEPASAPASSLGDSETILEIKRYKELLDLGIITDEEFTAKKRQLMGI